MSDCISLIDTLADIKNISQWVQVSQMTNIIHTEQVEITSVASGYLQIEPFAVPDTDCRIVKAVVYHCCETGAIHSFTDEPICHISQYGNDLLVNLDCWELNPKTQIDSVVYEWCYDPCQRLAELRDCMMEWLKAGKKKDWQFRDSQGSKSYLSEQCLKELIAEAQAECEALDPCAPNSRCVTWSCNSGLC